MALLAAVFLLVLFFPHDASAWGPGFHLQLGTTVLSNLQSLQPSVAALLGEFPHDFLYGCIAADITLGKKFTHYLQHCHRWPVGLKVLGKAVTKPQKACALGYLSHLAADTIAHNYYVPYKIMRSFSTLTHKHTYWEMRLESQISKEIWDVGRKVAMEHYKINDELLRENIVDTIFSFTTNKRIFNSILLLSRLEKWQALLKTVSSSSRYILDPEDRQEYTILSMDAVLDFLNHRESSRYFLADPTGERALATAEKVRKNLRILYKNGKITREQASGKLDEMKMKLSQSICSPALLQQIHSTFRERVPFPPPASRC
jgi:hypothetical protein